MVVLCLILKSLELHMTWFKEAFREAIIFAKCAHEILFKMIVWSFRFQIMQLDHGVFYKFSFLSQTKQSMFFH